jgi:hypothetical protein
MVVEKKPPHAWVGGGGFKEPVLLSLLPSRAAGERERRRHPPRHEARAAHWLRWQPVAHHGLGSHPAPGLARQRPRKRVAEGVAEGRVVLIDPDSEGGPGCGSGDDRRSRLQ